MSRSSTLRLLGVGALALVVATCSDSLTAPRRPAARIALAPMLTPEASRIMGRLTDFALNVNTVHLVITRPPAVVVKDTTVVFPALADTVAIELTVQLVAAEEELQALVELRDNDVVLFRGTQTVLARQGQTTGGTGGTPITLTYAGPGSGTTALAIVQRQPSLATGASLQLTTAATDAQGQPVAGLPLRWTSADATRLTIDANGLAQSIGKAGSVWAKVEGLNGLKDSVNVAIAQQPTRLTIVSGNGQPVTAGAALASPMVVVVGDGLNQPMANVTVRWRVASGGGTLAADSSVSDANGNAQVGYTSGTTSGLTPTIVASIGADSATFVQGGVSPAAAAKLALVARPTAAQVGQPLTPAPVIQLQDQYGNARTQSGLAVTTAFATGGTGRTLGGTLTVSTDASGQATFSDVTISGPSGPITLAFSASALVGVTSDTIAFVNNTPAQIAIVAGNGQKDTVGKQLALPLQVNVVDQTRVPVPNATIQWAVTGGSGSFSGSAIQTASTSTTGSDGTASVPFWLGQTAGEVVVTATVQGSTLVATFADTAVAGGPQGLAVVQLPSDTVRSSLAFVRQPKVQLTDGFGNPISSRNWVVVTQAVWDNPAQCTGFIAPQAGVTRAPPRLSVTRAPASARPAPILPPALAKLGLRPIPARAIAPARAVAAPADPAIAARERLSRLASRRLPGGVTAQMLRTRATRTSAARTARAARLAPARLRTRAMTPSATLGSPAVPMSPRTATSAASTCPYATPTGETYVATDPSGLATFTGLHYSAYVGAFNYRVVFYAYDTTGANANVYSDSTPVVVVTGPPATVSHFAGYDGWGERYDADTAYTTSGNWRWYDYYASPATEISTRTYDTVSVVVSDSMGNRIRSGTVRWTLAAGGGTLDSTQSALDSNGVARAGRWTVPAAAGTYTLFAYVPEWADSLEFTTIAVAPLPSFLDAVSGYDQAGAAGTTLPQPVAVRLRDQYQFPLAGATVDWTVSAGSGSFASPTSVTDASGTASATYTLSSPADGYTDALSAAVGTSAYAYIYETIPATGTTRRWTGADSLTPYVWEDPLNWSPAGVPTATDNVWLSMTTRYSYPQLAANATVDGFQTDYGASLYLGGDSLFVGGNLAVRSTGVAGTGAVVMTGTNASIVDASYLPALTVTNGATPLANVEVNGALAVTGGVLALDTTSVYVAGPFATTGTGAIALANARSSLYVTGDATFAGGSTAGLITNGTIYVGGNFTQLSTQSPSSFRASGPNVVYLLNDTLGHTVSFADSANSGFALLQVTSTAAGGTTFATAAQVDSDAYFGSSARVFGSSPLAVRGQLTIASSADLSGLSLITTSAPSFPVNFGVGPKLLRLTGTIPTIGGSNDYTGAVAVDSGASLSVDGQLRIRGDFTVAGVSPAGVPSVVAMPNEVAQFTIDGNALFDGGDESSLLQYGTLSVGGNFTQKASSSKASYASGTALKTVLDGSGAQTVSFASADAVAGSHFGSLDVANVSGSPVTFADTVAALGYVRVLDPTASGKSSWLDIGLNSGGLVISGPGGALQLGANAHMTLDGYWSNTAACMKDTTNVVIDGVNASQLANCGTTVLGFTRIATTAPRLTRLRPPPRAAAAPPMATPTALPKRN